MDKRTIKNMVLNEVSKERGLTLKQLTCKGRKEPVHRAKTLASVLLFEIIGIKMQVTRLLKTDHCTTLRRINRHVDFLKETDYKTSYNRLRKKFGSYIVPNRLNKDLPEYVINMQRFYENQLQELQEQNNTLETMNKRLESQVKHLQNELKTVKILEQ